MATDTYPANQPTSQPCLDLDGGNYEGEHSPSRVSGSPANLRGQRALQTLFAKTQAILSCRILSCPSICLSCAKREPGEGSSKGKRRPGVHRPLIQLLMYRGADSDTRDMVHVALPPSRLVQFLSAILSVREPPHQDVPPSFLVRAIA